MPGVAPVRCAGGSATSVARCCPVRTWAYRGAVRIQGDSQGYPSRSAEFPTSPAGLARAQSWLQQRVSERATLIVVEGTESFGAIVTERLQRAGLSIVDAARMPTGDRAGIGKNDELDATRIARAVRGLPLTSLRTRANCRANARGSQCVCSSWLVSRRPKNGPAPSKR